MTSLREKAEAMIAARNRSDARGTLNKLSAFAMAADVCQAYLAEHPADEEEPVTEEWLRSVGGVRTVYESALGNLDAYLFVIEAEADDHPGMELRVLVGGSLGGWECEVRSTWKPWHEGLNLATPSTRRAVRDICRALNIPLNPECK